MPISPRTDQFSQVPTQEDEKQIFEEGFSDMAHNALMQKLPDVLESLSTFKIIESEVDDGCAVGSFILERPCGLVYVPAILVDNQLKPMEAMYARDRNMFLPLTQEWMDELEKGSLQSMGGAVKTPQTLQTDVDIRGLIVPPMTGRYSYAAATDLQLPGALEKADNATRKKFANLLKDNTELLKVAIAIYGRDTVVESLRPRVEPKVIKKADFIAVTREDGMSKFKDAFGDNAGDAIRDLASKGYAVRDDREGLNKPVLAEETAFFGLEEAKSAGHYSLLTNDGGTIGAWMIPNPIKLRNKFIYDKSGGNAQTGEYTRKLKPGGFHHSHSDVSTQYEKIDYIGVTDDGKLIYLSGGPNRIPFGLKNNDAAAPSGSSDPKSGDKGFFLYHQGGHLKASEVVEVNRVTVGSDGVKRLDCTVGMFGYTPIIIVLDTKSTSKVILTPSESEVAVVPAAFRFIKTNGVVENTELMMNPAKFNLMVRHYLNAEGAKEASIKSYGSEEFSINGKVVDNRINTVLKLARDYRISVKDAELVVKTAAEERRLEVYFTPIAALKKLALDDGDAAKKKKPPAQPKRKLTVEEPMQSDAQPGMEQQMQDPGAAGGQPPQGTDDGSGEDPNAMAQVSDPNAMAQGAGQGMDPNMDPSAQMGPSPVELAVQDVSEQVANQHQKELELMQQKQENLQRQLQAIQAVMARAAEIEQGIPKEQSPALMANNDPSGSFPMPQGVPQNGMQPMEQQQPMGQQSPIGPGMMQQASGLADSSAFDAAAVGSLVEFSSLKDLVSTYIPTLEKGLDHLGRILLTLWIKGSELKRELGEEQYSNIEDRLRNVFRGLGDLILKLGTSSSALRDGASDEMSDEVGSG